VSGRGRVDLHAGNKTVDVPLSKVSLEPLSLDRSFRKEFRVDPA
jgi:hypothetical protein